MATWAIGSQVTARENTILTDVDSAENPFIDEVRVAPGALGIIVGVHGTAQGFDGRYARTLSVRFGSQVTIVGTDEVRSQDGGFGDVSALETAQANVTWAERMLATAQRILREAEREAEAEADGYCRTHDYFDCPWHVTMEQMADALART